MVNLQDFHQDFLQSVLSDAESRGIMKPQAFFENVCEILIGSGDLTPNYTVAEYTKKGIEVYGYDYDEERKILSLLAHQFFQEDEMLTLTKDQIDVKFSRLKNFFIKSINGDLDGIEETSEAYSMVYNIKNYQQSNNVDKLRLILLTDAKATRNLNELPSEKIGDIEVEFRVIDLDYIFKVTMAGEATSEFEFDTKLPCLVTPSSTEDYESYLTVIGGNELADIYEKFGKKLLEQNVRTFLQFRGDVNKGLRNTIEYKPEMFFAYNNGLTATATGIELDKEGNIIKIKNFQIVNGGQTTSAIYAARKNFKIDLSKVATQMKLSIVKNRELQDDFVSKVAEYANTQNKVNKSDFFSNSPFHKDFKNYSKRIWVAATGGSQRRTHWFYERVRGEYLNEYAYFSVAQKKQFQLENPKEQVIDKTLLSKSENSWNQFPQIVSRGAQYSFSKFAENITDRLEKDEHAITERYFKDAIARIILFKSVEKMISASDWYDGGFRAQVVAYTISYLSFLIKKTGIFFNFDLIWDEQKIPNDIGVTIGKIAERIYGEITKPPEGHANIAQWCKKDTCWERLKNIEMDIVINKKFLIDNEEQKFIKREDKKEKKIISGIDKQIFAVEISRERWAKLYDYFLKNLPDSRISPMQLDILRKVGSGDLQAPSEKQSAILIDLFERAKGEGFDI